jgi:hypothetical protein
MSDTFEDQLDLAFEMRRQHHRQHEVEQAHATKAIEDAHAELRRRQTMFCSEVRSSIEKAVEHANRHLARRPEKCQLSEVSGYFTGPLYVGAPACNPIAFELRVDGRELGETLIFELASHGMVEAFLGPFRPTVSEGQTTRLHLGWPPVPLDKFDDNTAHDLVLRYINTITSRWSLEQNNSDVGST